MAMLEKETLVTPTRGTLSKVGRFTWHFGEMMLAMMVGMGIFHLLVLRIPASSPVAALFQPKTVSYDLWMNLAMTVAMVAWMIIRKHGWRHSLEMAAASFVPLAVLAVICSLIGPAYVHIYLAASCGIMCLGMLAYMLYRRDHFTGQHNHSQHKAEAGSRPACH